MRRPRRFTALAVVLLVLQLIVLGSGVACAMPAAMPGMDGSEATSTVSMDDTPPQTPNHKGQIPADGRTPCRIPWGPAACNGMALCAPVAMTTSTMVLLQAPAIAPRALRLVVFAPASVSVAPELPPPRA